MEWKLTDEEIREIAKKVFKELFSDKAPDVIDDAEQLMEAFQSIRRAVAQAQLEKVVKKIEEKNKYRVFGFEDGTLLIYKEDWEPICRQVGLE